jgi:hypothetical protein
MLKWGAVSALKGEDAMLLEMYKKNGPTKEAISLSVANAFLDD